MADWNSIDRRFHLAPENWTFTKKNVDLILADLDRFAPKGFSEGGDDQLMYQDTKGEFGLRPVIATHQIEGFLKNYTRHNTMSLQKLWSSVRSRAMGISKKRVKKFLDSSAKRQIHAPTPARRITAPAVVYRAGILQLDLIEHLCSATEDRATHHQQVLTR